MSTVPESTAPHRAERLHRRLRSRLAERAGPMEGSSRRPLRVLALAFLGFFALFALWSLATPLMGAPDEPVQTIKAVAVVRGELLGSQPQGTSSPYTVVKVPSVYANAGTIPGCFSFKNTVPASCAPHLQGTATEVPISIYTGRYPPLYYAVVGLPSLIFDSASGVYLMRLVSAALNALFLALAVTAVVTWSRSRLLLVGLAVAVTPSALFFGGVINPSGFEMSSATCLWCSALVLAMERSASPPRALVALVGFSASVTVLIRGLSPLWVALTGLSVLALAGWRSARDLARHRSAQVAAVVVVCAAVLAVAWILHAHTLDVLPSVNPAPANATKGQLLLLTLQHTGRFLAEMIGQFGWLDTPAPLATYLAWYGAIGLLLLVAAATARVRQVIVMALVTAAAVLVPVVISASQAHKAGYVWQGKDSLPFALGVPLVAAELLGLSGALDRQRRRLAGMTTGLLAVVSALAFAGALRRNMVGLEGPVDFLSGRWHPPLGGVVLMLGEVVAALAVAVYLTGLVEPRHHAGHAAKHLEKSPRDGAVGSEIGLATAEGDRSG